MEKNCWGTVQSWCQPPWRLRQTIPAAPPPPPRTSLVGVLTVLHGLPWWRKAMETIQQSLHEESSLWEPTHHIRWASGLKIHGRGRFDSSLLPFPASLLSLGAKRQQRWVRREFALLPAVSPWGKTARCWVWPFVFPCSPELLNGMGREDTPFPAMSPQKEIARHGAYLVPAPGAHGQQVTWRRGVQKACAVGNYLGDIYGYTRSESVYPLFMEISIFTHRDCWELHIWMQFFPKQWKVTTIKCITGIFSFPLLL